MTASIEKMDYVKQLAEDMVFIKGYDNFQMKSENWFGDEKLERQVKIADFHLCKYPVTQGLWNQVMGKENNRSKFQGLDRPVEIVSWDDTKVFLKKLNQQTRKTYRLPSEAEWQYAAQGGKNGKGCIYAGSNKLKEVGWYDDNSHGETKPVGLKLPNELGLYDMSGNVWEWCADVWHENYNGAPEDGSAWLSGGEQARRVVRGGSWDFNDYVCRVSDRGRLLTGGRLINIGFRLAGY
mgnify:CR=1 FL=1